jgi:hypothetical protein
VVSADSTFTFKTIFTEAIPTEAAKKQSIWLIKADSDDQNSAKTRNKQGLCGPGFSGHLNPNYQSSGMRNLIILSCIQALLLIKLTNMCTTIMLGKRNDYMFVR